jgi:hypothetical protein
VRIPETGAANGADFIEIQLQDDAAVKYQTLANWYRTGAIYGILAPRTPADAPAKIWNKLFVRFVGSDVNVTINDVQVLQGNLESATADKPARPDVRRIEGAIGLQWNRSKAEFRKILIRPL